MSTGCQKDRQRDRQTARQTDRQTERQTDRKTERKFFCSASQADSRYWFNQGSGLQF